ncbi:hypothetical protein [Salinibacter ruber]|uniref:hypothetical protein n=1 Tax=Salinibacter ruber TaxID=146919 RepID=UPI002168E665|nr:hypothetical protein [Salinibacter ruber]MCS4152703.1 hypothetical protein [Salinibacter ruber]
MQATTAQPKASHNVTVEVDKIQKIQLEDGPTISITSADELGEYQSVTVENAVTVTSNAQSTRNVDVTSVNLAGSDQNGNGNLEHLSLKVSAESVDDGTGATDVTLISDSESGNGTISTPSSNDILTGFKTVKGSSFDLKYEAKVTEEYDPDKTAKVSVQYTLTSD